jgi:hypothetical protein
MRLDGALLEGEVFYDFVSPCKVCVSENVIFLSHDRERIEVRANHK